MGLGDQRAQALGVAAGGGQVPAMVAGGLVFAVGHKGALLRLELAHKTHQVLERVAFDVVFTPRPGLQQRGQVRHVVCPDVAFVGARVYGDARCTGLQADLGSAGDAGVAEVAPVAHLGHEVDVDGECGGSSHRF